MNKLFILGIILVSVFSYSQVGIGTGNPNLSADLELGSTNKGFLLNRVENLSAIPNPINGFMVYDISDQCVKSYYADVWSSCISTGISGSVNTLNCGSATNYGTMYTGFSASGVYSELPYTGGNGNPYNKQTINSSGVTGLTATLEAGTFANGDGTLTYNISGTPSSEGTASFLINKGGKTCELNLTVTRPLPPVPTNITLEQNRMRMVASVYDQDYWPYTNPLTTATTSTQAADGQPDLLIDIQGTITTSGIVVRIPLTPGGNVATMGPYRSTINIPASLTEDGITRNLIFSWETQTISSVFRQVIAKIATEQGTLNIKKLDLNAGIGSDGLGVLLGTFSYPYNSAGNTTTLQLRAVSGIPDKMYGIADNTGSSTSHLFIYHPVVAEDGKVWLKKNLGTNYSDATQWNFHPSTELERTNEWYGMGSLFQWGRKPDGHELVKYESGLAPFLTATTTTRSDNPDHALFIANNTEWRVTPDINLWIAEDSPNNPCPNGFKVPSATEFSALISAANITSSRDMYSNSILRLNNVSHRRPNMITSPHYYWTSTATSNPDRIHPISFSTSPNEAGPTNAIARGIGSAVRCIKS